jgi:hypothetical protein
MLESGESAFFDHFGKVHVRFGAIEIVGIDEITHGRPRIDRSDPVRCKTETAVRRWREREEDAPAGDVRRSYEEQFVRP